MPDPGDAPDDASRAAQSIAAREVRRIKAAAHAKLFGRDAAAPPAQPHRIARYAVLQSLGVGGMGEVYLAYDDKLARDVAIKLVRLDRGGGLERASSRLLREAQALAQLSHPNVVQVYETGNFEGRVFIAMEFVRGVHMRRWLETAPRTWRQVLDAYLQAGEGLAAAHRRAMVHRDFKPENVLVGDDGRVRVVDFGLVRSAPDPDAPADVPDNVSADDLERSSRLTQSGALMGTPSYMSPEQFQGLKATEKSDQFAFCVALYRGLYGWHPFASETRAELKRRVMTGQIAAPPRDAKVPPGIYTVLVRGLHADPAQRYPSMEALLAALVAPPRRRRVGLILAAGLAGLCAVIVAAASPRVDHACEWAAAAELPAPGTSLAGAFDGIDLPFAAATAARAGAQLDRYAADLGRARAAACSGPLAAEPLRERHRACLDRRTRDLAVVTGALARLRPSQLGDAERLAESLPAIAPCFDPGNLVGPGPPAPDLAAALDEARVSALAGRPSDAARQVERVLKEVGGDPLRAEAAALLGHVSCARGLAQQGRDQLGSALQLAITHRDDDLVADVQRYLAECTGDEVVARLAGATAERLRDPRRLTEVALLRAELLAAQGDPTSAQMLLRDTLGRADDRPATAARVEMLRGRMLALQGGNHEARAHLDQALALLAGLPRHPAVADVLEERARLHLRLGEKADARLRFGEALAIRAALPGQDAALARLHLALADLAAAAAERSRAHRHYADAVTHANRLPDLLPGQEFTRAKLARDTATGKPQPGEWPPRLP
ncbi:serine/threonine-protein kinase [Nannocystis bainbridge]|uniref:Serine/threonine-protein kinase n=1 Tax=Nannocystis bainbridge TaxID=2995303 RepID=A0ABT5E4R4_9BACT|nr:serine/threonine-protein kinase [Nannocystis bainbridge]MDC0720831.1 serine/threonine-protein kinase [Nannocystis bainbridge]